MTATLEKPQAPATDRANSDRHCHLASDDQPGVAFCGSTDSHHHAEAKVPAVDDPDACPRCGRPVCPVCRRIFRVYSRSGAWEGS